MAELSDEASEAVLGVFLSAFNAVHDSGYQLKAVEPSEDPSCDYLCEDRGRPRDPLKIQATRASMIVEPIAGGAGRPLYAMLNNPAARAIPGVILDEPPGLAAKAVRAKALNLGSSASDLVLLIFFDLRSYKVHEDLADMRAAVANIDVESVPPPLNSPIERKKLSVPFREVWSVWTDQDALGYSHRLWPSP